MAFGAMDVWYEEKGRRNVGLKPCPQLNNPMSWSSFRLLTGIQALVVDKPPVNAWTSVSQARLRANAARHIFCPPRLHRDDTLDGIMLSTNRPVPCWSEDVAVVDTADGERRIPTVIG